MTPEDLRNQDDAANVKQWCCFHCDEIFTDHASALEHFGSSCQDSAACQVSSSDLRKIEKQLERYRNEDTDLHHTINHMQTEHQKALMRVEELGYSRGLKDGRQMQLERL